MNEFLRNLRERKLVQWMLAYLAACFALIQVFDIVGQRFGWPEWVERALILTFAVGFFIALVVAWYHGERGAQRVSAIELGLLVVLLVAGGGVLWRLAPSAGERPAAAAPTHPKSIAVLPFENLSQDPDSAYFASGMRDEILTRLALIRDLTVISRTSTQRYASRPPDLRAVAAELGVASVLEGSVQRSGTTAHITVQLIDAQHDSALWADSYDRNLDDLFGVERDVARKVSEALKAQLAPAEADLIGRAPTRDAAAFDLYLRGLTHLNRAKDEYTVTRAEVPLALALFEQALEKDADFAAAAARLAEAHMYLYWFGSERNDSHLAAAKTAAERALALHDDGEAHVVLALHRYWGFRDYDGARAQLALARQTLHGSADIESIDAAILRRQGLYEQAVAGFQRVTALDPRNTTPFLELGHTFASARRYAEADRAFAQGESVAEQPASIALRRADNNAAWTGDLAPYRAAIAALKPGSDAYVVNSRFRYRFAWLMRDFAAAAQAADEDPSLLWFDYYNLLTPRRLYLAWGYDAAGDGARARGIYAELHAQAQAALAKTPASADWHMVLAFAEAGLGQKQQALAAARAAVALLPTSADAVSGTGLLTRLSQLYVRVGENDAAIGLLEQLLAMPAGATVSPSLLQLDPQWDPLREDARFRSLLTRAPSVVTESAHD